LRSKFRRGETNPRGLLRSRLPHKELDTNKDGFISRDELLEATMAGPPKAAKGSAASAGRREK
jgi:hypothetical protein